MRQRQPQQRLSRESDSSKAVLAPYIDLVPSCECMRARGSTCGRDCARGVSADMGTEEGRASYMIHMPCVV